MAYRAGKHEQISYRCEGRPTLPEPASPVPPIPRRFLLPPELMCNVTCSSAFDLNCHFNGKRHKHRQLIHENESNTLVDLENAHKKTRWRKLECNESKEQTALPDSELELLLNRVHEVTQKDGDAWLSNVLHNTKCIPCRPATCDITVDVQEKQSNKDSPCLDLLSTKSPNQTTPGSSHSGTTTAKRKHSPCQATKAKRIASADTEALVDSSQGTP